MEEVKSALTESYESDGYEIDDITVNRNKIRVSIRDPEASGEDLRHLTYAALDEDDVFGFNVTTESTANDQINTIVSFQYRG